ASAERAAELGGTVVAPPFDVFDAGRMAAIQDPQGAILSVWEPKENIGAGLVNVPGALTWNDVLTPDLPAAAEFYKGLFGWEISEVSPPPNQYLAISNQGRGNGGLLPLPPGGHPAWNLYFLVEDVDAAVERINALGGGLVAGPMDVPNGTRFAIVRDSQNAV